MLEQNPILQSISNWFNRTFSNPEALGLTFFLVFIFVIIQFFAGLLMPILIAVVLSYLFMPIVHRLEKWKFPHWLAVTIVFLLFISLLAWFVLGLIPLLVKQLTSLIREIPQSFSLGQKWLNHFLAQYPSLAGVDPLGHFADFIKERSAKIGQMVLSFSLATLPSLFEAVVYLVLVPILVFFFMKDGKDIASWGSQYLPKDRGLIYEVLNDMNTKIGAFMKGHIIEMFITGFVSVIAFSLFGLNYAALLGFVIGLSTWIPYVGAVVVTIPVVIIGLMQWGMSPHFFYLIITYAVIMTLDGNLLGPMLMSEAVDLHPIVVILAITVFGGIWGFWGVFFAVPLAALVKVILSRWPRQSATTDV